MSENAKRAIVVLLIICLSIGVGFTVDAIWSLVEQQMYPTDYSELILQASKEFGVPEDVIFATIKVESDFDPNAISSVGARGLMQMMPSTFEWLTGDEHLGEHRSVKELKDPEISIRYGTYYLSYLYKKFNYNWDIAFAAYNGGETNVAKWLKDPKCVDEQGNLTYIPIPETANYVKKIKKALEYYQETEVIAKKENA